MSLYNIDENKNMVLDALFAPYDMSPTINLDVTQNLSFPNIGSYIDCYKNFVSANDSSYIKPTPYGTYMIYPYHISNTKRVASIMNYLYSGNVSWLNVFCINEDCDDYAVRGPMYDLYLLDFTLNTFSGYYFRIIRLR